MSFEPNRYYTQNGLYGILNQIGRAMYGKGFVRPFHELPDDIAKLKKDLEDSSHRLMQYNHETCLLEQENEMLKDRVVKLQGKQVSEVAKPDTQPYELDNESFARSLLLTRLESLEIKVSRIQDAVASFHGKVNP